MVIAIISILLVLVFVFSVLLLAMMMKFMLNVAAITWMMRDSRMGLVLTYNVVGPMSNNVSQYIKKMLINVDRNHLVILVSALHI